MKNLRLQVEFEKLLSKEEIHMRTAYGDDCAEEKATIRKQPAGPRKDENAETTKTQQGEL